MASSSYRIGDLFAYGDEMYLADRNEMITDFPNSIATEYYLKRKKHAKDIDVMTEIVLEKIIQFSHLLPNDIEESTVVHARLGDVVAGNEWFEKIKRPFDIDYVKSLIPINQKTYVIGKCDVFGKWSSFQNRNESTQQSNNYLEKLLSVCDAHHFNSGDPDIDLCCAVKSKTFIQGRGNYSYIIVEIRKKLNLETIETEIETTTTTK